MSHDVIYFPSEKCLSDGRLVCLMDPSEPSESRFIHRKVDLSIAVRLPVLDIYDNCTLLNQSASSNFVMLIIKKEINSKESQGGTYSPNNFLIQ